MISFSTIIVAVLLIVGSGGLDNSTSGGERNRSLLIVRQDYREFCGSAENRWNLTAGTLTIVTGKCAPHMYDPPDIKVTPIGKSALKRMRFMASQALVTSVVDQKCVDANPGSYVQVGSGPLYFYVMRGNKRVQSPNMPQCLNATGEKIRAEMAASLARAKR